MGHWLTGWNGLAERFVFAERNILLLPLSFPIFELHIVHMQFNWLFNTDWTAVYQNIILPGYLITAWEVGSRKFEVRRGEWREGSAWGRGQRAERKGSLWVVWRKGSLIPYTLPPPHTIHMQEGYREGAISVAEPVLEPIFWSVGAESRSRLFKAAPAPSFRKAKNKNLVYVFYMNSIQIKVYR